MLANIIELADDLALLAARGGFSGFITRGWERKVWLSLKLRLVATPSVAFLLSFGSLAPAGITAPQTASRESIRVVMDDNYPPYTFRDSSGRLQGILVDQWALWEEKTGIPVRLDAMDWAKAQQRMEAGDYDVIDTMFKNDQRKALYDFSAPYTSIEVPLFFSRELSGLRGPKDLEGFVVGAKSGDNSIEILKASGVANFLLFDNYEAIVAAARDGKIKVFTIDKPPALYFLIKMGIQDQFRESEPLYTGEFHRAVRKGNTALLGDVQRGFNAITKDEYEDIDRHWCGAPIFTKARLTLVAAFAGGAFVIVCLLLLWVGLLRRSVRQRTAELQKDITERIGMEVALLESEEKYRRLVWDMQVGVLVQGPHTEVLLSNPKALELLGLSEDQLLGRTSFDPEWKVIHEDGSDFPGPTHPVPQAIATGTSVRETIMGVYHPVRKDHIWLSVDAEPQLNPDGTVRQVVCTFVDVTEQKKMKEALTAQSTALAAVIDNNPLSIQILDSEGRTIRTNPAFFKLFGAIPPPAYSMFSDPTLAAQGLSSVFDLIRAGEVVYFPETTYNVHDLFPEFPDRPVWIRALGFPILGEDGRPERFVLVHEDISQRRKAEAENAKLQAQLLQAQKMEGLGSLAGGIAHDMNNVLGAILGMASANIAAQPVGSSVYRAFDTIAQAAIRGGKMVKSLLNFAHQSPTEERELDMNAILREEVELLERTTLAKIRLEMDLASDLRPILGDASALTNAFMNLCVNAVDAMPDNGTLTLRTRNVDTDWIEVLVEDTGTGMPREVLEKAMDPFFTTKGVGKGTGLGLSMVYSTVKAHRGQIEIQSEPGQGTRVRMRFPACEPLVRPSEPAVEPPTATAHGMLDVLLVDDDELIQSTLQEVLGILGHSVTAALSGEEALAKLEAGFQPDAVILDMNMPGLGGAGTLPRLRALRPTLPVLLATGRADEAALDLIQAHQHVTLMSKPFSMKELKQHLERLGQG